MSAFQIPEKDLKEARATTINWIEQVNTLVDGYRSNGRGVLHGVQKDAIQNSWGARKEDGGKNWKVTFELVETPIANLFVIEDYGTSGLTGRVLKPEEYLEDLPAEERWGRFESLAFSSGQGSRVLGSRGRGKFIFVGASEDHVILYDTLREDGTYRFGFRTVTQTQSPVAAFDDGEGKKKLGEYTKGNLKPIDHVGTRVVIVNPIDEIVKGFDSGEFERAISETWWEIIKKYGASIKLIQDGKETTAGIPKEFLLGAKETASRKVWGPKKDQALRIGRQIFKVKELYIACDKTTPVPEDIRGVSIQRAGMKICHISHDILPREIADSLFGYIVVDKELEAELIRDESPEHYSFVFNKTHPRDLKGYIERETLAFCREKLGFGLDPEKIEREKTKSAERRALNAINSITNKLGLTARVTSASPSPEPPPPTIDSPIKLVMPHFELPNDNGRVNYGQEIKGLELQSINKKGEFKARVQLKVLFQETIIKNLLESDITIKTGGQNLFGPETERVTREEYQNPGKYTVHAKMVSLEEADKGTVLDELKRHFYVEQDPPPLGGIFEECIGIEFPEEHSYMVGFPEKGSRGGAHIFRYNINHPAKKAAEQDEDSLTDYLVTIMALALSEVDLNLHGEEEPKLLEKPREGKITGHQVAIDVPKVVGKVLQEYFNQ